MTTEIKNSSHIEEFNGFKIRINTLIPDQPTTFDLFLSVGGQYILYLHKGDLLEKNKLENLKSKDSGHLFYIQEGERKAYRDYMQNHLSSEALSSGEKALILRESALNIVEELFEGSDIQKSLNAARPVVGNFIEFMKNDPSAMGNLISLSSHDFYTYNHSLDVSIYAMGLASRIGFQGEELEEMGMGALFHDIGKRQIDVKILCKRGALTEDEWTQMQKHPEYGLALLLQMDVSDAVRATCFEHHESFRGGGYPRKIAGEEIHPFARIVALCDTYDALTTQRSYNTPLKPVEALNLIHEKLNQRYDPEMLKALYAVLLETKQ